MPVKALINFAGIEEYMRQLQELSIDIDQAASEAVSAAAPIIKEEIVRLAERNRLTGATVADIYMTDPQSIGSFHFVELGAKLEGESAAIYNEFGTARMAAQPFIRPALNNVRTRWRNSVKATLKARMGVDFG